MSSLSKLMLVVSVGLLSPGLIAQECENLKIASVVDATDYLRHAGDDPAAAGYVQLAFHQIAISPPDKAIPLLVTYLGYKRPLNAGERNGIFMHGNAPSVLYPAVHELGALGDAAEAAIVSFVAERKDGSSVELENALYALLLIRHGDAVAVIQELRKKAATSPNSEMKNRLEIAAKPP